MLPEWIKLLTKPQKARLKRHVCGSCEVSLHTGQCAAMFTGPCSDEVMQDRAARCLEASRAAHIRNHQIPHQPDTN